MTRGARPECSSCSTARTRRHRNSVPEAEGLRPTAPTWETRLKIIGACTQEVIADHGARPRQGALANPGGARRLYRHEHRGNPCGPRLWISTLIAWAAWERNDGQPALARRHRRQHTCAERTNVPGYGEGAMANGRLVRAWSASAGGELFKLDNAQLDFFRAARAGRYRAFPILGWRTIAKFSHDLHMEDAVVEACRRNLLVWELYLNGICRWRRCARPRLNRP